MQKVVEEILDVLPIAVVGILLALSPFAVMAYVALSSFGGGAPVR